ncbi:MAG: hypothetical protein GF383_14230 [Candidatus Lokiarchaeota archaeon]|nr:hypothetical protein [Candidatus Lokiarchaeota archaeon]MBD3342514.1 hypothetical protein [Candidatus Lokiarchaeota archaeon]
MPKGCFALLLPSDSEYNVLGYYIKDKNSQFTITDNLFLRLNLDHSKNDYNLLKLKDYNLVSYLYKFKGKIKRKALGVIVGLILNENEVEDAEKFRVPLKNTASKIETINPIGMEKAEFEVKLKKFYIEFLDKIMDRLDPESLKAGIINKTKEMLSGGRKERKIAQELLEKIEDKVHVKISELYQSAEEELKALEYDKAAKHFKKAADIAEELRVEELAKNLKDRSKLAKEVPVLTKEREKMIEDARFALKNEDFNQSSLLYKKASEISKKLMEPDKHEEYALKSKALQDFYQADQRFKK